MRIRMMLALLAVSAPLCSEGWGWEGEERLRQSLTEHEFNGVVLVAEGEQVVFQEAFGYKDFEKKVPADVGTAYEVGSVSKPFTAAAVLMLEERGQLSLTDPLTKYFPTLPYPEVTLERMLSHTSGLYDVCCQPELRPRFDAFYGKSDPPYTNRDYLAFIEKETPELLAAPGETYRYSNTAYVLLALIVEQVSGVELDEFLNDNIFEPAGLERTFLLSKMDDPAIPNFAVGYERTEEGEIVVDVPVPTPERPSVFAASYGDDEIVSTAGDLFAFGRALLSGKLLSKQTLERAWTPARLVNGDAAPYGLGFRIDEREDGTIVVFHTGSTNGFLAMCTFPTEDNDTAIILLTNVVDEGFAELRAGVFDIVSGTP